MKPRKPRLPKTRPAVTADTPVSEGGPDWSAREVRKDQEGFYSIPRPWIMRYPNAAGDRREIRCSISTWRGMSVGATHYYARVTVQANAVWCPERLEWHTNSHETLCKDIFYRAHVDSKAAALNFCRLVLEGFYADQTQFRWCVGDYYGIDDEDEIGESWHDIARQLEKTL